VIAYANLTGAIAERGLAGYDEFYEWSRTNRAEFWGYTADRLRIRMSQPPTAVLGDTGTLEYPDWFSGARLNIAESCFLAPAEAIAVRQQQDDLFRNVTYGELRRLVNRAANGLRKIGIGAGDRVAIAMPMNLEAVVAYLGIVLTGAVVVSIADSFTPQEIAARLRIGRAGLVVTQDVIHRGRKILPMYDKLIRAGVDRAVVVDTGARIALRKDDLPWSEFLALDDEFVAVPRAPGDHMNILFSSGTTGDPKAIPWTHLAPIKAASDGHYHQDIHPGDVVVWPTNLGWMMGPWLIYATFINGAAMALSTEVPTGAGFARFVEEAGVTVLGVVPSLVAAWRASGAAEVCNWSRIRLFSSTGEAANPDDMAYLMDLAGNKPVMDYIGGTEIAGGYMSCTMLQPYVPATFTTPTLGGGIHILDEVGNPAASGELFIEPPCVGLSVELLNRDHHDVYYAGTPDIGVVVRRHGDHIEKLPDGRFRAHGRVDDAMNLGGIKVGSAEIERSVMGTPGLVESAAIAVEQEGGGPSRLVMYVVVEGEPDISDLQAAMQERIGRKLNPLFKISEIVVIDELPRTASAKTKRRSLRADYLDR
jgi:acetyl-CoA synthetase